MTCKHLSVSAASMVLLLGFSTGMTPASAETAAGTDSVDTITVVAPRITVERPTGVVSKVITAEKNARVAFSDLDLARTADLHELEARVSEAATGICNDLTSELPFGQPSTSACIRRAVDDAMSQVREATHLALTR